MPGTLCKRVILATGKCNLSVSNVQWRSTVRAQNGAGDLGWKDYVRSRTGRQGSVSLFASIHQPQLGTMSRQTWLEVRIAVPGDHLFDTKEAMLLQEEGKSALKEAGPLETWRIMIGSW